MSAPSTSSLVSARAVEAVERPGRTMRTVRLAIADADLESALRQALDEHDLLRLGDDAAVTIADHELAAPPRGKTLRVGPVADGHNAVQTRDPALILAAALLLGAGYTVERTHEPGPWVPGPRPRLSPREQQVGGLLLEGASNKLIARALGISVHTAKFHVTAILDKLGARNRADAVSIILREGLIAL
jgi:DNA-binding CsgD family transcriptional regulator